MDLQDILKGGKTHFTLIDPDNQSPGNAGELAAKAEEYGSDAIMVGGSTAGNEVTDTVTKAIRRSCNLPTILFPSTAAGVSAHADHIFWMMLMNSKNRRFLVGEQMKAAPHLKKMGVDPIPMGYVVISTSREPTTVEKVGEVDRIGEEDIDKAVAYSLTAEYYGMSCVYLEAGSGADKPVPVEMVRTVRGEISVPLIVGGGMRTPDSVVEVVEAGADVIVTGTIAERDPMMLARIISAVKAYQSV
ncbi:MAG: geranylgeranylglyceryl/heptaprenylglyceryl phosphate synthase [Candidatus Altiarchaeales archaeon]|nr:geranylgeranylglyceryl/heptaprenylglyceryl phosphate synthase [Candidatus Altiarchaeales archaeon]MBD3415981.1 geranylgeranylglyceryl/heptaprenylglyceryl phosphate synthase [Candidatus Altiarchaeales archaeon]